MSDRSLRGMRLGSQSMETESNVQPAPRQRVEYRTADGDRVFVTFAAEAEIPSVWTAKSGKEAYLVNGDSTADAEEEKPARTTGICSWNAAASKSWKRLWKTA